MPASFFSRSTECHNQDKVSMGTIAARDCLRVLELTEQTASALALAVRQGVELRRRAPPGAELTPALAAFQEELAAAIALVVEDRPLEPELRRLIGLIRGRHWQLYA
jgi:histidine ammonia-lyase